MVNVQGNKYFFLSTLLSSMEEGDELIFQSSVLLSLLKEEDDGSSNASGSRRFLIQIKVPPVECEREENNLLLVARERKERIFPFILFSYSGEITFPSVSTLDLLGVAKRPPPRIGWVSKGANEIEEREKNKKERELEV